MALNRCLSLALLLALFIAPAVPAPAPEEEAKGRAGAPGTFVRMDLPFPPEFTCAAWMPDGSSMLAAGPDGWIARYYPANQSFVDVSRRGGDWVPDYNGIAISPASREALVVGDGGVAVSVSTENRVGMLSTGTANDLSGVSFMGDGTTAYISGANRTLVEFDATARKMTVQDDLLMPSLGGIPADTPFGNLSFRPGGTYALLSALDTGAMYRLSDGSVADITYKFDGLAGGADISWSPDGSSALVSDNTSHVFLWDGSGESSTRVEGPPGSQMVLSAWRNAGEATVFSTGAGTGVYDYTGAPALSLRQTLDVRSFRAAGWRPDGSECLLFAVESGGPAAYRLFVQKTIPPPSRPVPSDINATAVWLTWSWSPGDSGEKLDHYLLLHSPSEADLLNVTPLNAYTNTSGRLYNLLPSTRYYLLMRVVTGSGLTADSPVLGFSTAAFTLPQAVSPYLEGYTLRWRPSSSPNISKYDLYYAQRTGLAVEGMAFVNTYPAGQSSYAYDLSGQLGTTFREGSTYYFRVRTVNRDGGVADSVEATFSYNNPPASVAAGTVTDIGYNSVRLSWARSGASDFSAYIIEYRQYMTGTWKTALKVSDRNTTSAVVGSLESDTRYDFRIKVQDKGGKTSATSEWSVHPRTDENIAYEIFSTVFGDPAVCLPVSFMLLFMTAAGAAGMAKAGKAGGAAAFGSFSAGFALLVVANLLQLLEVFTFSPEQKLFLLLVPIPFAVAIAVARRARRARSAARERAESERRATEERAAGQRRRADETRAKLEALGPRLAALERTRGPAGAPEARNLLAQAGQAYSTGNLDFAQELAARAEKGIREVEETDRNRRAQAEDITRELEMVDQQLQALINMWLNYDPVKELGVDPLRLDRARLDAARKDEDARLQSAQAKQQQAGVLLGQGRIAESRDLASAALSEVERLLGFWTGWNDLKARSNRLGAEVESAASWASIDARAYRRRLEDARLALAVQDTASAATAMNAVKAELDALAQTHRPALSVGLPPREYRLNRFDDLQFTVRNTGRALARKIDVALEAPADFGPGGAPSVKLVSMAPGGSQDCRLNLAFTREGSVPVLFTLAFEDNAGNRVVQEPVRLTVNVLGR